MKRLDAIFSVSLVGLAAFVGNEALQTRYSAEQRTQVDSGAAAVDLVDDGARGANRPAEPRAHESRARDRVVLDDIRRRLESARVETYIDEVLAAHDSALARWPDRQLEPLRVWVQPAPRIQDWTPSSLALVRNAFAEWGLSGIPLSFTFVVDSSSADVRVTWVDRFSDPISGKTLWTHDERWWILDAQIVLAVHHRSGESLDAAAVRAIALHEVGHLVGLDHTRDSTSIMAPRVRVKQLSSADRATARLLYALPPGRVTGGVRPAR